MDDLKVEIIRLEPMIVASAYAYGKSPEIDAWKKLETWAEPLGLLHKLEKYPVYGYNNPPPMPDNPEYGYEFLMKVDPGARPSNEVRLYLFYGGPYAVTRCEVKNQHMEIIPAAWKRLEEWCKNNGYKHDFRPGLEKHVSALINPDELILDLYFPIKEK
jgi:DNA gyrase inhibitor GyrI